MATIDRQLLLPKLIPNPDQFLMIAGLAGASKDAAGFTKDGANLFTMAGTMGASVSMGLGVALSEPKQPVISIAGDGELIMGIGSLLTVASMSPDNLTIICIDNGMHAETGGQLGHTSRGTDLAIMAKGAGIASVMTIEAPEQIKNGTKFIIDAPGPRFLWARVNDGPPTPFKRDFNLSVRRQIFRTAYAAQNKVNV